jgi:hypothetical protein
MTGIIAAKDLNGGKLNKPNQGFGLGIDWADNLSIP